MGVSGNRGGFTVREAYARDPTAGLPLHKKYWLPAYNRWSVVFLGLEKEFDMDVKSGNPGFRLGSVQLFFVVIFLLPFGSANATGSIGRQVASFCAPAMTVPDVSACSACHMTSNESKNDLNAAGMQARAGSFASFCPATTPTPTPTPTPEPGTGTGGTGAGMSGRGVGAMGSGMTGMSRMRGSRGMSGTRGSRGMWGSGSRSRSASRGDNDDEDDDDRDDD